MSCCSGKRRTESTMRYGTVWNPPSDGSTNINPGMLFDQGVSANGSGVGVDFVDGHINIHGQLVGGQPPPMGPIDQISNWVKQNPVLAAVGAIGGVWLFTRK